MATSYPFTPIITDNMVLNIDSLNTKSYSGGNWLDLSKDNNVTLFNSPNFNKYLEFDGVNNYGTIDYNSDFDLSSSRFTIETYFNSYSYGSPFALISKDTYGLNFDWAIYIVDRYTIIFYSNGTGTNVTANLITPLGDWIHVVVTKGAANAISIYVNGVLCGSGTMSVSNASTVKMSVGSLSYSNPGAFFNGLLSTIRIYREELSNSQIIQNYKSLKNRT